MPSEDRVHALLEGVIRVIRWTTPLSTHPMSYRRSTRDERHSFSAQVEHHKQDFYDALGEQADSTLTVVKSRRNAPQQSGVSWTGRVQPPDEFLRGYWARRRLQILRL
jgi:hypothetical protein